MAKICFRFDNYSESLWIPSESGSVFA